MNRLGNALLMVTMTMSILGILCISFLSIGGYVRASSTYQIESEQQRSLVRAAFDYAVLQAIDNEEQSADPKDIQPVTLSPWPINDATSSYAATYSVVHRIPGIIVKVLLLKNHEQITTAQGVCTPVVTEQGQKKWRISSSQIG